MTPAQRSPGDEPIPPEIKGDALAAAITELARTRYLPHILEIGASSGDGSTEAFVAGMRQNPSPGILHCIEISPSRSDALRRRWADEPRVKCYNVSSVPRARWASAEKVAEFYRNVPTGLNRYPLDQVLSWLQGGSQDLQQWQVPEDGIARIRREHGIDRFDAVLIDGSAFTASAELDEIHGARFILLDDVNDLKNYENYHRLLADPQYVLMSTDWRVRNGFAIFALASEMPGRPQLDPLPVHFWTIALDGEPFIRYHIDVLKNLPFQWHWHIIEGVADLVHDTAWSLPAGGRVPSRYPTARSIDGTSEYLDELVSQYPHQITLYRKPPGVRWNGKLEMVSAPIPNISRPSLLWEIDCDELWTAQQFITARNLFLENPNITAAYYWCWFFVGPDRITCTRFTYGNRPPIDWMRTWRFRPGMHWASHEPPRLAEEISPRQFRDAGAVNPILHDQTEALGLIFQHFAFATEPQVVFKQEYYGYQGAVEGWQALQAVTEFPVPLKNYFPWVNDEALVDLAEYYIDPLLFDVSSDRS